MALVTVDEADALHGFMETAQAELERVCDREFEFVSLTETIPAYRGYLYPRRLPLVDVTSVTAPGGVTHEVHGDRIFVGDTSRSYYPAYYRDLSRQPRLYTVQYTGGYHLVDDDERSIVRNVPVDLEQLVLAFAEFVREYQNLASGFATGAQAGVSRTRLRHMKNGVPGFLYDRSSKWRRTVPGVPYGYR